MSRGPFHPPPWTTLAACNMADDPDLFHPVKPSQARMVQARRFCDTCSVVAECRKRAEATGSSGIWAGEWFDGDTEKERWARTDEEIVERVKRGEGDQSIARMTNISVNHIQRLRKREGLPAGHDYAGSDSDLPFYDLAKSGIRIETRKALLK